MKGYKFLIPIFLIAFYGLSIYVLYSGREEVQAEYDSYLSAAREKREEGITTDAEENYMAALGVIDSVELQIEIGEFYREQGANMKALRWAEDILEVYKEDVKAYEFMFDIYYDNNDIMACFDLYDDMNKYAINSKTITDIINGWEYEYYIDECEYTEVGAFSYGACPAKGETKWGYVNSSGSRVISPQFDKVGPFCDELAPVVTTSGEAFFIDTSGDKKKIVKNVSNIMELGMIENGIFALYDGWTWGFYTEDGTKIAGDYDDASNMGNGYAAVRNIDEWSIINSSGEVISGETYDSVVADEKKIIVRSNRIFVEKDGKYYMLNEACEKVTEESYEGADIFRGGTLAAVKIDGKWGFVNDAGEVVIEPQYDGARSFAGSYAAVKVGDKWGFIKEDGTMIIEPAFDDAKDFTSSGTVFVKQYDFWDMLCFYKYNH